MNHNIANKTGITFQSIIRSINIGACIMMSMWMCTPYIRANTGVVFIFGFFTLWFITTDLSWVSKKITKDIVYVLLFYLTLTPYILTNSLRYGSAEGKNILLIQLPLFFLGMIINHYYLYYKSDFQAIKIIGTSSLLFYFVGALQTLQGLIEIPMASRIIASGVDQVGTTVENLAKMGVGGYGFIYGATFLIIGLVFLLKNTRKSLLNPNIFFILFLTIALIFAIVKASFAISIFIFLVGVLFVLFSRNWKNIIVFTVIVIVLYLIIPSTIKGNILLFIANYFPSDNVMYIKLRELGISFTSDINSNQLNNRLDLYMVSLKTFLKYPLFGIYGPLGNKNLTVGGHSSWLDFLAYYGLFSSLPLFAVFINYSKKQLRFFNDTKYSVALLVIHVLFGVLGLINPVIYVYELGYVIFFILPCIPYILKDNQDLLAQGEKT